MDNIQITKDCIQSINNIGSTTYQNICNGNMSVVNWGTGDCLFGMLIGLLCVGLVIMMVVMIKVMITE